MTFVLAGELVAERLELQLAALGPGSAEAIRIERTEGPPVLVRTDAGLAVELEAGESLEVARAVDA
jgi:hypothetical protein